MKFIFVGNNSPQEHIKLITSIATVNSNDMNKKILGVLEI